MILVEARTCVLIGLSAMISSLKSPRRKWHGESDFHSQIPAISTIIQLQDDLWARILSTLQRNPRVRIEKIL